MSVHQSNSNHENDLPLQYLLPKVCQIAYEAGQNISQLYHQSSDVGIEQKSDGTPVTQADKEADEYIRYGLSRLDIDFPMVTEESVANIPFEDRQAWSTYWLVDPLDGTKEFIAKTGEYSVNIALIHNHKPVLGVVYGPETGNMYFAYQRQTVSQNAEVQKVGKFDGLTPASVSLEFDWLNMIKQAQAIQVSAPPSERQRLMLPIRVAVSRRHGGATDQFMSKLGYSKTVQMGSALKTCLVAEGLADVYPRFGPTSLWDTAAAQCILEVAGGAILNAAGHPLEYVQTESLLNPFFIAVSQKEYNWPTFPEIF